VSRTLPKSPRLQLDPESYERLRQQVLLRNRWGGRIVVSVSNLEDHHKAFRSHSGHDSSAT